MAVKVQLRRGTASEWQSANPTLSQGELGVETDTTKFKVGNGSTAWNSLGYASVSNRGTYSGATQYYVNDIVQYLGATYICNTSSLNNLPTNTSYWTVLAAAGEVTLAGAQTLTNKTLTSPVITTPKITDTPFVITDGASVDINPSNGFIQTWTLSASRTPIAPTSFTSGQAVMLAITAGSNSITWSSVGVSWTRQGGSGTAPTLSTTGVSFIILHKLATTIYGSYLGDA